MPKTIFLNVKMLGKKRPSLATVPLELPATLAAEPTLRELLSLIVSQQVHNFNQKRTTENFLPYLDNNTIQEQAKQGKISFGAVDNQETVELEKAIETALQAYEDGLFYVFVDQHKVTSLEETLILNEASSLMFLRLVALVGGYF